MLIMHLKTTAITTTTITKIATIIAVVLITKIITISNCYKKQSTTLGFFGGQILFVL